MDAGQTLRDAREQRGWSQAEAAFHLGINRSTVSRWESGATDLMTHRWAKVLETYGYAPRIVLEKHQLSQGLRTMSVDERLGDGYGTDPVHWRRMGLVLSGSLAARLQGVPVATDEVLALVEPGRLDSWQQWVSGYSPRSSERFPAGPHERRFISQLSELQVREVSVMPPTLELDTVHGGLRVVELTSLTEVDVDPALLVALLRQS